MAETPELLLAGPSKTIPTKPDTSADGLAW
jgi:hypothetical protein